MQTNDKQGPNTAEEMFFKSRYFPFLLAFQASYVELIARKICWVGFFSDNKLHSLVLFKQGDRHLEETAEKTRQCEEHRKLM